jgi:hypothetical protein
MSNLKYDNTSIQKLAEDLINALTNITPGNSLSVGGVDTKGFVLNDLEDDNLILENVLSFSIIQKGDEPGYFTHDPLDSPVNRQPIAVEASLNFGGAINFFSYLKIVSPVACILDITYILRA